MRGLLSLLDQRVRYQTSAAAVFFKIIHTPYPRFDFPSIADIFPGAYRATSLHSSNMWISGGIVAAQVLDLVTFSSQAHSPSEGVVVAVKRS